LGIRVAKKNLDEKFKSGNITSFTRTGGGKIPVAMQKHHLVLNNEEKVDQLPESDTSSGPPDNESLDRLTNTVRIYTRLAKLYSFFRYKDGLKTVLKLMRIGDGQEVLDVGTKFYYAFWWRKSTNQNYS